ncbi:hypothetical protein K432DRAFT_411247 [Lepidopterella palustris CBS 459.81]|uniref:Ubiquitin 3 binding protein But2 C-terminal domain-containing protein n=1 Tax=Lepidopterella palustris CBS 459.81 TaxID=1314670 RepID=A0A8E2DWI8_9PEZI|nr:hypothetical protein K432DRAFT_411247 [Lepidopterella palustris CBS 459.81]
MDLSGDFQFPHLIAPIDSSYPHDHFGPSFNGDICGTKSTLYTFDIPKSYAGKHCELVFLFPNAGEMETSSFKFSGHGELRFSELESIATSDTTYASAGKKIKELGSYKVEPGNTYLIEQNKCPGGQSVTIEIEGSEGMCLDYFQDWNPKPIGLYVNAC